MVKVGVNKITLFSEMAESFNVVAANFLICNMYVRAFFIGFAFSDVELSADVVSYGRVVVAIAGYHLKEKLLN